jgi:hypothetical protein
LVLGMSSGVLSFRETHSLREVHTISLVAHGAVHCLWFSEGIHITLTAPAALIMFYVVVVDGQFLFAGSGDGSFSVLCDTEARWKLLNIAVQKTPLLGSTI